MLPSITDSKGKQSKTLFFVTVSFIILNAKFLLAGLSLGAFGTAPNMSATDYGIALGVVLGMWLGREWREKTNV